MVNGSWLEVFGSWLMAKGAQPGLVTGALPQVQGRARAPLGPGAEPAPLGHVP